MPYSDKQTWQLERQMKQIDCRDLSPRSNTLPCCVRGVAEGTTPPGPGFAESIRSTRSNAHSHQIGQPFSAAPRERANRLPQKPRGISSRGYLRAERGEDAAPVAVFRLPIAEKDRALAEMLRWEIRQYQTSITMRYSEGCCC